MTEGLKGSHRGEAGQVQLIAKGGHDSRHPSVCIVQWTWALRPAANTCREAGKCLVLLHRRVRSHGWKLQRSRSRLEIRKHFTAGAGRQRERRQGMGDSPLLELVKKVDND